MNLKAMMRPRFFKGAAIALGLVVSLAIAGLAIPKEENTRSRDFLCNDFWQNGPLKKLATQHHLERCKTPAAQSLARVLVDSGNRLLRSLPIVHSVNFGEIEAETSWKEPCQTTTRLKIARRGKVYIDELLASRFVDTGILNDREETCDFYNIGVDQIKDLDGDLEPEILVSYYTKGAHCCAGLIIYYYNPKRDKYDALFHYFGEWGYQEIKGLKDLDENKILEFKVLDDSLFFDYKVGITEIWQYRQGQMYNVTRRFLQRIRQSEIRTWEQYDGIYEEAKNWYGRGLLTASLAYKYMLGEAKDGWQKVQQTYAGEDREEVLSEMKKRLRRLGYIPGTHTERVHLKPESAEITGGGGSLAPNQKRRHLLAAKAGQQLTVKLRDIAFEKGTINIRIFSTRGRLLATLDRYEQRSWKGKAQSSGDYIIEVSSPTGAKYDLEFYVL